jgi:methylmalonyl-CoA mutase N-terminal domain/subunit
MTINAPAAVLLAMYIAVGKRQGVEMKQLRGTIQNDILKEYVARGTYIFPPTPSLRLITDIFQFCEQQVPNWNTISISGYHIREAGSTAVQEVAFTLADAIEYVKAAIGAGLEVDNFASPIMIFSRRSPSSAPPGGCGPRSCATASVLKILNRGCCASIHKPVVLP